MWAFEGKKIVLSKSRGVFVLVIRKSTRVGILYHLFILLHMVLGGVSSIICKNDLANWIPMVVQCT